MSFGFGFEDQLSFSMLSRGKRSHEHNIARMLPGVLSVVKANAALDRVGIDYIAALSGGVEVKIDLKIRDRGCSLYWRCSAEDIKAPYAIPIGCKIEEFALETWSAVPDEKNPGKIGWTLDKLKETDYTLHSFDPSDSRRMFLLPFQLLRKTFIKNGPLWYTKYKKARQSSRSQSRVYWNSECVFVPAPVVIAAINTSMVEVEPEPLFDENVNPAPPMRSKARRRSHGSRKIPRSHCAVEG